MKKFVTLLCCALFAWCNTIVAQGNGDKIIGTYKAVQSGNTSKVKIFKYQDGYRAQVIWLQEPNNPDGTPKKDHRNPDKAKRNTLSSQVVLVEKVTYENGEWKNGKIYDPTRGKTFKVTITFKNENTLSVKGSFGPFSETVYWTKIE